MPSPSSSQRHCVFVSLSFLMLLPTLLRTISYVSLHKATALTLRRSTRRGFTHSRRAGGTPAKPNNEAGLTSISLLTLITAFLLTTETWNRPASSDFLSELMAVGLMAWEFTFVTGRRPTASLLDFAHRVTSAFPCISTLWNVEDNETASRKGILILYIRVKRRSCLFLFSFF